MSASTWKPDTRKVTQSTWAPSLAIGTLLLLGTGAGVYFAFLKNKETDVPNEASATPSPPVSTTGPKRGESEGAGFQWWVWLLVGVGALVIIGIILYIVALINRKEKGTDGAVERTRVTFPLEEARLLIEDLPRLGTGGRPKGKEHEDDTERSDEVIDYEWAQSPHLLLQKRAQAKALPIKRKLDMLKRFAREKLLFHLQRVWKRPEAKKALEVGDILVQFKESGWKTHPESELLVRTVESGFDLAVEAYFRMMLTTLSQPYTTDDKAEEGLRELEKTAKELGYGEASYDELRALWEPMRERELEMEREREEAERRRKRYEEKRKRRTLPTADRDEEDESE